MAMLAKREALRSAQDNKSIGENIDPRGNDSAYLAALAARVRGLRARRGMTRKALAAQSGVSERYLAQMESGEGNASVLLLRDIARALNVHLEALVKEGAEPAVDLALTTEFLRGLSEENLAAARQLLGERFGAAEQKARRGRVALIGLRGAGKSTLGKMLAEAKGMPFLELDKLIEEASGVSLGAIFDLYGQAGFRRLERRCLDEVLERYPRFVLATGGSLVSEAATFGRLLTMCYTVWLKANAEDHMARVVAQGDMRPMAENGEAMEDLRRILEEREGLYGKADLVVETSGRDAISNFKFLISNL